MTGKTRLHVEPLDDRCLPSFSPAVAYGVGSGPYDVVTADFNGDGLLDLATANYSSHTVSVLLGNANGTFQPARTSATGTNPLSLAVGDFNGDQILDVATANQGSDSVSVLLGTGTGTFQVPTSVGVDPSPTSVTVGDFNGDGTLDLGVTSVDGNYYGMSTASVLLGNGSGGFTGPNSTWLGYYAGTASATAANLDGVGPDELVVTENSGWYPDDVWVLTLDESGFLQITDTFDSGALAYHAAVGDVNADGNLDFVTANWYYASVSVLLGDGLGGFGAAQTFAAGNYAHSLALGDFTGDGNVDIAVTDYYGYRVNLLSGAGNGTFAAPYSFATGPNPASLASGDFDGDGWLDLATANYGGSSVSVLINDQSWSTSPPPPPTVMIGDATVTEGNAGSVSATFTLTLSAAYGQPVTVNYSTANGTATAGSDYLAAADTVIFAPGETSKTITVTVLSDQMYEPTETFAVNLSSPTNATIADGTGVGTIVNDDTYVVPQISIGDVTKAEGRSGFTTFTFTVTLSEPSSTQVTVNYSTASGTATAGEDYTAASGTLTFAPGETTKTFTIKVKGDRKQEADETFFVNLFGVSSNALILDDQGIGTILNDD